MKELEPLIVFTIIASIVAGVVALCTLVQHYFGDKVSLIMVGVMLILMGVFIICKVI